MIDMTGRWVDAIPYFSREDLACKGTGVVLLDIRFAIALPALREAWGKPLKPTSVCRSTVHNTAVGGHPSSLHLVINPKHKTNGCCAADIAWKDWTLADRLAFARLAWKMGWAVGLHNSFCHIDLRKIAMLTPAVFLYGASWSGEFDAAAVQAG